MENEKAAQLVQQYKERAYDKAVEFAVVATNFGDAAVKIFADAAIALIESGYHKSGATAEQVADD